MSSGILNVLKKYGQIGIIAILFCIVGPGLIVLNKYLMQNMSFPYPIAVSNLGMASSVVFSRVCHYYGIVEIKKQEALEGRNYYTRVMLVGLAHATTLIFGNWVYLYLGMGLVQMLKAFSPVMLLSTQVCMNIGKPPTIPVVVALLTICFGTCITCLGSLTWNYTGLVIMIVSIFAESVRLALTQFFLQDLKLGVIEGMYYMAPASSFWLFLASIFLEAPLIMKEEGWVGKLWSISYMFVAAGIMGLIVNFVSYSFIRLTSSLTLKVVTSVRNIAVIFIGIIFFAEQVTMVQFFGYTVALGGFIGYQLSSAGWYSQKEGNLESKSRCDSSSDSGRDIQMSGSIRNKNDDDDQMESEDSSPLLVHGSRHKENVV